MKVTNRLRKGPQTRRQNDWEVPLGVSLMSNKSLQIQILLTHYMCDTGQTFVTNEISFFGLRRRYYAVVGDNRLKAKVCRWCNTKRIRDRNESNFVRSDCSGKICKGIIQMALTVKFSGTDDELSNSKQIYPFMIVKKKLLTPGHQ